MVLKSYSLVPRPLPVFNVTCRDEAIEKLHLCDTKIMMDADKVVKPTHEIASLDS